MKLKITAAQRETPQQNSKTKASSYHRNDSAVDLKILWAIRVEKWSDTAQLYGNILGETVALNQHPYSSGRSLGAYFVPVDTTVTFGRAWLVDMSVTVTPADTTLPIKTPASEPPQKSLMELKFHTHPQSPWYYICCLHTKFNRKIQRVKTKKNHGFKRTLLTQWNRDKLNFNKWIKSFKNRSVDSACCKTENIPHLPLGPMIARSRPGKASPLTFVKMLSCFLMMSPIPPPPSQTIENVGKRQTTQWWNGET